MDFTSKGSEGKRRKEVKRKKVKERGGKKGRGGKVERVEASQFTFLATPLHTDCHLSPSKSKESLKYRTRSCQLKHTTLICSRAQHSTVRYEARQSLLHHDNLSSRRLRASFIPLRNVCRPKPL